MEGGNAAANSLTISIESFFALARSLASLSPPFHSAPSACPRKTNSPPPPAIARVTTSAIAARTCLLVRAIF